MPLIYALAMGIPILELASVGVPVGVDVSPHAFHLVVGPLPIVFLSIGVRADPLPVSLALAPLAYVPIPTFIGLGPLTMRLSLQPAPFVYRSVLADEHTLAMFLSFGVDLTIVVS